MTAISPLDYKTSPTSLYSNQSTIDDISSMCLPMYQPSSIGALVLLGIEVLWNVLILVAIISSYRRLKRNLVYLYVANLVVANIALGLVSFYTYLAHLVPLEKTFGDSSNYRFDRDNASQAAIMQWWAFRKALVPAMFHVMSLGLIALMYGISNSAIFISRVGLTPKQETSEIHKKVTLMSRQKKVLFIIMTTWLFTLGYSFVVLGWNCVSSCRCLPGIYNQRDNCSEKNHPNKCSNVWPPLTNGHVLAGMGFWLVLIFVMLALLVLIILKYKSVMKPPPAPKGIESTLNDTIRSTSNPSNLHLYSSTISMPPSSKRDFHLHPTIKLLIVLSVVYTLCTGPFILCFTIDALHENPLVISDLALVLCNVSLHIYCFISPIILIIYMPGLRAAFARVFLSFPCMTTTVTVKNKHPTVSGQK